MLGIAYAGLGRKDDALREEKLGVELLPISKDALRGPYRAIDLARIFVMVGEYDEAVTLLGKLLAVPSDISTMILRRDPAWAPLRGHPGFERLIASPQ